MKTFKRAIYIGFIYWLISANANAQNQSKHLSFAGGLAHHKFYDRGHVAIPLSTNGGSLGFEYYNPNKLWLNVGFSFTNMSLVKFKNMKLGKAYLFNFSNTFWFINRTASWTGTRYLYGINLSVPIVYRIFESFSNNQLSYIISLPQVGQAFKYMHALAETQKGDIQLVYKLTIPVASYSASNTYSGLNIEPAKFSITSFKKRLYILSDISVEFFKKHKTGLKAGYEWTFETTHLNGNHSEWASHLFYIGLIKTF